MQQHLPRYSRPDEWVAWPVSWSAVWVGALAGLGAALIFGLLGTVLGVATETSIASFSTVTRVEVALVILAAFFSWVIAGWTAVKISGIRHAEPAILHGVISWLIGTPIVVGLLALGAGNAFGGWDAGFIAPHLAAGAPVATPEAVRNTALAALTTLLVGLVGAVIGGWMACGEPMTFTHHRERNAALDPTKGGI